MTTPFSPPWLGLAGSSSFRRGLRGASLLMTLLSASPAEAGSIEVRLTIEGRRPLAEAPIVLHPPYGPDAEVGERVSRPGSLRGFTDRRGSARFLGVPPGRYTVTLPRLPAELLQPSENPVAPAPVVTLFDDEETLTMDVRLQVGLEVGVAVDAPAPADGFVVHYRHRDTGFELFDEVHPALPRLTRRLSDGLWDVWVSPPPGRILADVERDGTPLPGAAAALDLTLPDPRAPPPAVWLTFTYSAPATVEGDVIVTGGPVDEVDVVATLVRAGDWFEEAEERGGSLYSPVRAPVGPDGRYRLDLPAGAWRVSPQGTRIVAREPREIFVEAKDAEVTEADFEVELDPEPRRTFRVRVRNVRGEDVEGAVVQLTARDHPAAVLRHGVTLPFGVELEVLPVGHYLLLAGHPDYLEAELPLDDFDSAEAAEVSIELAEGGRLDLRAADLEGRPARLVEWTIEHLDPPLELKLREPVFTGSKKKRVAVTDDSGRVRVPGLYAGFYRLRAERPAYGLDLSLGGLFHVRHRREAWTRTVDLYLTEDGADEAWARQLPAANLRFQLLCDDQGPPPPEAAAVVIDLDGPAEDIEAAKAAAVLARDDLDLVGRDRDLLVVGPLDQGVYRLALRPAGFTRWTWAYETYDGTESYVIQIDVDEKYPASLLDLGPFKLECGPAVDLVPEALDGELPDLRQVGVRARLLDVETGAEAASYPAVTRRRDRAELRRLAQGRSRLELVLSHPHFLPEPDLEWRVDLDLRRGEYVLVTPQIARLGGALKVVGLDGRPAGASFRVEGEGTEPLEVIAGEATTIVPSLDPGTFDVRLCGDRRCEEPLALWRDVEVRRGETAVLEVDF